MRLCVFIVCTKDLLLKFLCQLAKFFGMILSSDHNALLGCGCGNLIHLLGQVSLGTIQLCCQLFIFLQRKRSGCKLLITAGNSFKLSAEHSERKHGSLSEWTTCWDLTARS